MKHHKVSRPSEKPTVTARPASVADRQPNAGAFTLVTEDDAQKAYLSYVKECALPGYDVQYWLDVETQTLAQRHRTDPRGVN